uniref:Uncharacterized protein n=1 Tax=Anguilla anguilla TaxID=7936 RepID=A0A0E9P901_ANGAN
MLFSEWITSLWPSITLV